MITLPAVADRVVQALADASMTPYGLSAVECRLLAQVLDKALVVGAPLSPAVRVVSLAAFRRQGAAP